MSWWQWLHFLVRAWPIAFAARNLASPICSAASWPARRPSISAPTREPFRIGCGRVGPSGPVFAFEPQPELAVYLSTQGRVRPGENLGIAALSSSPGELMMRRRQGPWAGRA